MRSIGQIPDKDSAARFSDYLYSISIENNIEEVEENEWEIWIHGEEEIPRAKLLLKEFIENTDNPKYADASATAEEKRRKDNKEVKAHQKRQHSIGKNSGIAGFRLPPTTMILICISVFVALLSMFGQDNKILQPLLITEYQTTPDNKILFNGSLPEVLDGQIWRLITPIFIHFHIFHILFNMMWLKDLGSMIERAQGHRFFLLFVLISAVLSNIAQFFVSGPSFGGMSGVVYALLAYAWIRGKLDLTSGLFVHKNTMMMMSVWFFLCFTGFLGPMANTVHAVGLGIGLLWGYTSAQLVNARR